MQHGVPPRGLRMKGGSVDCFFITDFPTGKMRESFSPRGAVPSFGGPAVPGGWRWQQQAIALPWPTGWLPGGRAAAWHSALQLVWRANPGSGCCSMEILRFLSVPHQDFAHQPMIIGRQNPDRTLCSPAGSAARRFFRSGLRRRSGRWKKLPPLREAEHLPGHLQ